MKTVVNQQKVNSWQSALDELYARLACHFPRRDLRYRAQTYLSGLLAAAERKNGWGLAEEAGEATPYGIQHLLRRANWDADEVRDDLREYVVEHLGAKDGVLIVDETGFLKKGDKSAGVKRQYTGTAGKRENAQVGVFLAYASQKGAAFIDRELYLPEEWASDLQRRREAGVGEEVEFATKPQLGRRMLERAFEAEVPISWVVADSVYGDARGHIGVWLEEREQPFVLGLSGKAYVWASFRQHRVGNILDSLREGTLPDEEHQEGFKRLSAGFGSKGERLYEWLRIGLSRPLQEGFRRWLLVRRNLGDPEELTAYMVFAPEDTSLEEMAKVAGRRWEIEAAFEEAKSETGLDEYEVRSWAGWYRHITLSLLAHASLAAIRASDQDIELLERAPQKGALQRSQRSSTLAGFKRGRGL